MATHWTLGCDANDPHRLADFWAKALDYVAEPGFDEPDVASIIDPDGHAPAISWLRVARAGGQDRKNRLHIDFRVAGEGPWDVAAPRAADPEKVPELKALGATIVREERYGEVLGHVVMLEAEGNESLRGMTHVQFDMGFP